MKTINLVDLDKSDIKYQHQKFPDGQQNIVIQDKQIGDWSKYNEWVWDKCDVQIKSRLNNWLDLELITCAVASLRELGVEEIHLYVPYIMGARSDRKFEEGGNNYVKHVIAPAINLLNFKTVTCIDPHSDVLEACIKGFRKESNIQLVYFALTDMGISKRDKQILVSPDAGASKKIYKLAEQIGYKGDIITCSKERDKDGKLTKCVVPDIIMGNINKDILIIDDIFDFGGTFVKIAKELETQGYKGKKYLAITHSIQTEGLKDALKWFDAIYTTNSVKEHNLELIKQLNVF